MCRTACSAFLFFDVFITSISKNKCTISFLPAKVVLRPDGLCKAGAPRGLLKKSSSPFRLRYFSQSLALSGHRTIRQVRKGNSGSPESQMFNNPKECSYEQKQLHTDEKIPRDSQPLRSETDGSRNQSPESILRKPETVRLLSAPNESFRLPAVAATDLSVDDGRSRKWETELDGIIRELMVQ